MAELLIFSEDLKAKIRKNYYLKYRSSPRNREKARQASAAWRAEHPDYNREYCKRYYQEHKYDERYRAVQKANQQRQYWADPEKARERAREYYRKKKRQGNE